VGWVLALQRGIPSLKRQSASGMPAERETLQ
jgi:hypothetical protein